MRDVTIGAVLVGMGMTAAASAQPAGRATIAPAPGERSVAIAALLPIGVTAASLPLVLFGAALGSKPATLIGAGGVLVGPTLGRVYVGDFSYGGAAACALGLALVPAGAYSDNEMLALTGIGLWAAAALYQVVSAPLIAHENNDRLSRRVLVTPSALPTQTGLAPGLLVGATF